MLVSVLLPVRNAEATIERAVESVLRQSFRDLELLIGDDFSSDSTASLVKQFAQQDSRVRLVRSSARGLVPTLNELYALSKGSLIARMDADDESLSSRLEQQVSFLSNHETIGLISCCVADDESLSLGQGIREYIRWSNSLLTHEMITAARFIESPLIHPTVLFRREVAESYGVWREGDFPEDYELWLRWLAAGVRFEKLQQPLYIWNDVQGRLSRSDSRYRMEAFYSIKAPYLLEALNVELKERAVVVWGAGRESRRRIRPLQHDGLSVSAWIDVDPKKIGSKISGAQVLAPSYLEGPSSQFILTAVGNRGARNEIESYLIGNGYAPKRDFLHCA